MIFVSDGIYDLGQLMMSKPHDWIQSEFRFSNTEKGIRIWTANSVSGIKIVGLPSLGYYERRYINKCIQQTIANKLKDNGQEEI